MSASVTTPPRLTVEGIQARVAEIVAIRPCRCGRSCAGAEFIVLVAPDMSALWLALGMGLHRSGVIWVEA